MGEIADMTMDGTLCEQCGCLMEDLIMDNGEDLKDPQVILEYVKIV